MRIKLHTTLLIGSLFWTVGCMAQLHVLDKTSWVSTNATIVVLDNTDLQYDAKANLNNTFRFTGAKNNTIGGTTKPAIYAISLAKTNPAQLSLNTNIDITKRIHFESGLLDLNANNITLDPAALLINESDTSRIIGPKPGGYITIIADLSTPPISANPGNLGALITSATSLGKINIFRSHDPQPVTDTSKGIARWFAISVPDNITNINAGLRFNYLKAETAGFNDDSLTLWQTTATGPWANQSFTNRDASLHFVEKQGLTRLGNFTVAANASTISTTPPLNVILLFGNWIADQAHLIWTVTPGTNIDHFTVERKYASETNFTVIASIPATGTNSYAYTDSSVKAGPDNISYRIHEIPTTVGVAVYSNIVTFKGTAIGESFIEKLYPTIATGGRVYIKAGNMALDKVQFEVYDAGGRRVSAGTLSYQSQWLTVSALSHGVYRLVIHAGDKHYHSTFIR